MRGTCKLNSPPRSITSANIVFIVCGSAWQNCAMKYFFISAWFLYVWTLQWSCWTVVCYHVTAGQVLLTKGSCLLSPRWRQHQCVSEIHCQNSFLPSYYLWVLSIVVYLRTRYLKLWLGMKGRYVTAPWLP